MPFRILNILAGTIMTSQLLKASESQESPALVREKTEMKEDRERLKQLKEIHTHHDVFDTPPLGTSILPESFN